MKTSHDSLYGPQQAAAARLLYAVRQQQGVAVLCGPGGTGVSTVLDHVANELESAGLSTIRVSGRNLVVDQLADLRSVRTNQSADRAMSFAGLREGKAGAAAPVLLVDDGHGCEASQLAEFVATIQASLPSAAIVLAGRGRLLTLLAREQELQEQVLLRAVLPPWALPETAAFVRERFAAARVPVSDDALLTTMHEIAAGIPQAIVRLVETAVLIAKAHPAHLLRRVDVEQMHDRLSLAAA